LKNGSEVVKCLESVKLVKLKVPEQLENNTANITREYGRDYEDKEGTMWRPV